MALILTIVGLTIAVFLGLLHVKYHIFQYAYFLRVPIIYSLTLFFLPFVAVSPIGRNMIGNFYVLEWNQLIIVTWLAVFSSWMAMYTTLLVFVKIAPRVKLRFGRPDAKVEIGEEKAEQPTDVPYNEIPDWLYKSRLYLSPLVLATPTVVIAFYASPPYTLSSILSKIGGVLAGVALAIVFRLLAIYVSKRVLAPVFGWFTPSEDTKDKVEKFERQVERSKIVQAMLSATWEGYRDDALRKRKTERAMAAKDDELLEAPIAGKPVKGEDPKRGESEQAQSVLHRRALAYLTVTLAAYAVGFFVLNPIRAPGHLIDLIPALAYVLLLLLLVFSLMPALTFFFDKLRVPAGFVVLAAFIVNYQFCTVDHYYELKGYECGAKQPTEPPPDPASVVEAWSDCHPDARVMTVVAASGGGITAAYWIASVLDSLGRHPGFGTRFLESIAVVSANSGGSVGSMYVVDAYKENAPPDSLALIRAAQSACTSSLGATGWGLVYPDLARVIGQLLVRDKLLDRAWAQEQRWGRHLENINPTLSEWKEGVMEGWRPAMIFNTTHVETGKRFLVSPIYVPPSSAIAKDSLRVSRNFVRLYPGADMEVVTAARLSATFPYVTPISRPIADKPCEDTAYHVADGGYYDNFGVVTALEFIESLLDRREILGGRSILLLQIRTSKREEEPAESDRGWVYELVGPGVTLMKVRTSSQIARNEYEIALLRDKAEREGVSIIPVTFELRNTGPLSWHLSEREKREIRAGLNSDANWPSHVQMSQILGESQHPAKDEMSGGGPTTGVR